LEFATSLSSPGSAIRILHPQPSKVRVNRIGRRVEKRNTRLEAHIVNPYKPLSHSQPESDPHCIPTSPLARASGTAARSVRRRNGFRVLTDNSLGERRRLCPRCTRRGANFLNVEVDFVPTPALFAITCGRLLPSRRQTRSNSVPSCLPVTRPCGGGYKDMHLDQS